MGRNNSKPSSGSSGHAGGMGPGQTRKKPKDLSAREREERPITAKRHAVKAVCSFSSSNFFFSNQCESV